MKFMKKINEVCFRVSDNPFMNPVTSLPLKYLSVFFLKEEHKMDDSDNICWRSAWEYLYTSFLRPAELMLKDAI